MYQYFKIQLKTPTCFGSSGIHSQGVLKVLHWNYLWSFVCVVGVWQLEIWTSGVCVWCDALDTHTTGPNFKLLNTDYAHKTSQVISVKHF